ncbi:MAG: PQQ-binding-like beta-propeller repeat protein [Anaerolineaceae bacterium]|nr:PQQ-binding-like beta-propeller repeat protein [Anaerolineaceae bacterium]
MRILAACLCVTVLAVTVTRADDWPQFRGPNRDGKSAEKGLMKKWPSGGPRKLWSAEIGQGYSSVAVVGGKVYATGYIGSDLMLTALDAGGRKLWRKRIDSAAGGSHGGARGTPTVDGDKLYILSGRGKLVCLKRSDGSEAWSKNILSEYGASNIQWKLSESVLIDGDKVICAPGGRAALVALNKETGQEIWASPAVDAKAGYASAMLIDYGGLKQVVTFSQKHVFGVNADNGKLLWKEAKKTDYDINATSVVFTKGVMFVTSGYNAGGAIYKMRVSGGKVSMKKVYTVPAPDDKFGGVVLIGTRVYGTGDRKPGLTAVDLGSGQAVYTSRSVTKASNIYADGRLYCQGHNGTMQLVDPKDGKVVSSFKISLQAANEMWAHPAISDGKLYIHHDSTLSVYKIKGRK